MYIPKRDDETFASFVPRIPLGPQTIFFLHFRQKSSFTTLCIETDYYEYKESLYF